MGQEEEEEEEDTQSPDYFRHTEHTLPSQTRPYSSITPQFPLPLLLLLCSSCLTCYTDEARRSKSRKEAHREKKTLKTFHVLFFFGLFSPSFLPSLFPIYLAPGSCVCTAHILSPSFSLSHTVDLSSNSHPSAVDSVCVCVCVCGSSGIHIASDRYYTHT